MSQVFSVPLNVSESLHLAGGLQLTASASSLKCIFHYAVRAASSHVVRPMTWPQGW